MDSLIWQQVACAASLDVAGAAALRLAAGTLLGSRQRGSWAATVYLCAALGVLLTGGSAASASARNALVLGAAAAAVCPGGLLLSAVLLAAGSSNWLPGAVLLVVPLAVLSARETAGGSTGGAGSGSSGGSGSGCGKGEASNPAKSLSRSMSSRSADVLPVLKCLAAYTCCFAATTAALSLAQRGLSPQHALAVNQWLGSGSWQAAVPAVQATQLQHDALAWVGARITQQPLHQHTALVLPAASLQPGLGLHWYLLAQAFPQFRAFFVYALNALPAAIMLPLALRFAQHPSLLLVVGALARCLLHPQPGLGMVALWVGLLPLAAPQLEAMSGLPWLALGMGAALLLSGSASDLWLVSGGGNANFLYGMNLLWAGLQALLLLRLLRAAARQQATGLAPSSGQAAGNE